MAQRVCPIKLERPVVSFTFDDFPVSALLRGGETLREHNALGTYYVALGLLQTEAPVGRIASEGDVKAVAAAGHELGCHTFAHCHSYRTAPRPFEESVAENQAVLNRFLPGVTFRTMSYPISCPRPGTKRRMEKRFSCCRGGGQAFNRNSVDLNNAASFFLEKSRNNIDAVKRVIDQNAAENGWLIFSTHDVTENPTQFGCTPAFFRDAVRHTIASGAQILPVSAAVDLLRSEASQ